MPEPWPEEVAGCCHYKAPEPWFWCRCRPVFIWWGGPQWCDWPSASAGAASSQRQCMLLYSGIIQTSSNNYFTVLHITVRILANPKATTDVNFPADIPHDDFFSQIYATMSLDPMVAELEWKSNNKLKKTPVHHLKTHNDINNTFKVLGALLSNTCCCKPTWMEIIHHPLLSYPWMFLYDLYDRIQHLLKHQRARRLMATVSLILPMLMSYIWWRRNFTVLSIRVQIIGAMSTPTPQENMSHLGWRKLLSGQEKLCVTSCLILCQMFLMAAKYSMTMKQTGAVLFLQKHFISTVWTAKSALAVPIVPSPIHSRPPHSLQSMSMSGQMLHCKTLVHQAVGNGTSKHLLQINLTVKLNLFLSLIFLMLEFVPLSSSQSHVIYHVTSLGVSR